MTTEERLENWAECYRDRLRRQQALSFEGAYRSKQSEHWLYGLAPPAARPALDWMDAQVVNGAWQSIPDAFHQMIIGGWYVRKWSPAKCVRVATEKALGVANCYAKPSETEFARVLRIAQGLLEQQLELPVVFRLERVRARVIDALGLVEWRRLEAQPLDSVA